MDTAAGIIAPVIGLVTLQFHMGALVDGEPVDDYAVHLVKATTKGTPGPALCGLDRFHPDSPGWSVGGGVSGPGIVHKPCPGCGEAARERFPGLEITGLGAKEMAALLGVPWSAWNGGQFKQREEIPVPDVTPAAGHAAADELSAALNQIKADHEAANPCGANADDPVPRLVAAVEAALKLTGEWDTESDHLDDLAESPGADEEGRLVLRGTAQGYSDCAADLRAAIASALAGGGGDVSHR